MTFGTDVVDKAGQDQLEVVANKFAQWRSTKTTRAQKVPDELMREAQELSKRYRAAEVRRRLGLSKAQMDKLDQLDRRTAGQQSTPGVNSNANSLDRAPGFVKLVPMGEQPESPPLNSPLTIDICTPQGVKISLSGFANQNPLPMIAKLIGA
jgi:hypothetical protein